ncbi:MAG: RIP metalloprotease RseP [Desulfosudaceae bacterium]
MTSIVALVIVLGVLIFFHESGHFLLARLFGVGVERFSLGFGPRLLGFQSGRTDYRLSAIPLGGYVKMVGEDPEEEIEAADKAVSFTHKPVWQRSIIVAAGPVFNLLLAILIFYGLFLAQGQTYLKPVIGEVSPDMPAAEAGIRPGDQVKAVNEKTVTTWSQMANMIEEAQDRPLSLSIKRQGDIRTFTIEPRLEDGQNIFGEPRQRYLVGIAPAGSFLRDPVVGLVSLDEVIREPLGPVSALVKGVEQTARIIGLTGLGVAKIIAGSVSSKEIGGPILIAQMAGQQAEHGLASLLAFIAFISINLAIINILPIPVLDGGHLMFYACEAVRGKPVTLKTRETAQQIGLFLIFFLMILAFYNDIMRFFE